MSIRRLVVLVLSVLLPQLAHAAAQRTFVASTGNDANPCTIATPCRSFAAAIAQVMSGGVVAVLDSAGYGPVNVNVSVSIIAPTGVYAGITVSGSQEGVHIGGSNFNVTLRGLTISGSTGTPDGIVAFNSGTLDVDSCMISTTARGIFVFSNGPLKASIRDTVIRDSSSEGITITGSGPNSAVIDHVHIDRAGGNGIAVTPLSAVEVRNSVVEHSFAVGIRVDVFSMLDTAYLTVTNSMVSHNGTGGLYAFANHGAVTLLANGNTITHNNSAGISGIQLGGGTSHVIASRNTISLNSVGMDGSGITFDSVSDNAVVGNGTDLAGTIVPFFWK